MPVYASTFHGSLSGNASTATKATQDESGNNIKATYGSSLSISGHTIKLINKNGSELASVTVPDNNSLTGVKGNAESSYRTGNVNLTPANILGTGTTAQF